MKRKRMTAAERKERILDEARRAFSRHGFDRVRTSDIARAVQVSEALIYRHFPTKRALYRAVLRRTIREQDANHAIVGLKDITPGGLIRNLRGYFQVIAGDGPEDIREGFRLLLASVAGDAGYASLVYRRANRIMNERVHRALLLAQERGDLSGRILSPRNTSMFTEHIGTMMNTLIAQSEQTRPYAGDRAAVIEQAVWFCARGLGFTEAALARYLAEPAADPA